MRAALIFMACALAATGAAVADAEPPTGITHALLINGGSRPESNYQSHLHHLEGMLGVLEARGVLRDRISVFSADGQDNTPDQAVRDTLPAGFWLLDGLPAANWLKPRAELKDSVLPGVTMHPANKAALRKWFQTSLERLGPYDWLLLFVTDHGTGNTGDPNNGAISLWREKITVKELRGLLDLLPPGVRTVMLMSQCYSGSFAAAMYDGDEPSGRTCGFFSTARDQKAYGCYPEGRDRDQMGYAFQVIEALQRRPTLAGAHQEAMVADDTPDIPLRTSDLYLESVLTREAAARGQATRVLADQLLQEAWKDRRQWDSRTRLVDRMAEAFGIISPRSLAEIEDYEKTLPELGERIAKGKDQWNAILLDLRKENMEEFLRHHDKWAERLKTRKPLDAAGRTQSLHELLSQLEQYSRDRPEMWSRLGVLRDHADRLSKAEWRLQVRRGALQRMRSVLLGIAGRVLVNRTAGSAPQRAVEGLENCESLEPGGVPPPGVETGELKLRPFPGLDAEIRMMGLLLPSWLGLTFGPVPAVEQSLRGLPAGASRVNQVLSGSPAMNAGLIDGDIILGPPGRPFESSLQLREWAMASPSGTPMELSVLRPGPTAEEDQNLELSITLRPYPGKIPGLPAPSKSSEVAPALPPDLVPVGEASLPDLSRKAHILFFWATWCMPCKAAVPEVLAYAELQGLPVLAISDEEPDVVSGFLKKRSEPFFEHVAVDSQRRSKDDYAVHATPTMVIVNENGLETYRQVGYTLENGLKIDGWSWTPPRSDATVHDQGY